MTASLRFLLLLLSGAFVAGAAGKPNVLVVLFDDLGYSDLGCYGGEIPTPAIDALAQGGLRFTHLTNSARCCPTRASLLTGLHPAQAGIRDFGGNLAANTATLAEVLRGAGYSTYAVGKWHVGKAPAASPVARGFDEFYGYTNGHSADQWQPAHYQRLPAGREPELKHEPGNYYATDAFTGYALEFIKQGEAKKKPWFVYLAHSSPHFPIQAPAESSKGFLDTYRKGWDVLRADRFRRMKEIGLANHDGWRLGPPSLVPVEKNNEIANGYSGQPNPAWESLDPARREDLARRMAIYAAMVKHVDDGMARIVRQLKDSGSYENTLILLLSDNGACYEWGPFGFDGVSRSGKNVLHEGAALGAMGTNGEQMSYGSAWANLCNTPFRLYKHFTHEGGITSPFIVHWPKGIVRAGGWVRDPVHVMDLMPTLVEVSGAVYPESRAGHAVQPAEGISLAATFRSGDALPERAICVQHEGAFSIRKGRWKLVKGKRFAAEARWELYDIKADPVEGNNLAAKHPELVASLGREWDEWAARTDSWRAARDARPKPNFVMVFIDDMGWGDLSCFGNREAKTPNLDALAAGGIRFTQFYVNSPICSPSRCALTTGQYPQRWKITSFLNHRADNERRGMAQWLDPAAPSLARILKSGGYATGHFGKWHLGGQRDVADAPPITAYGFDVSLTNFEGMGPKLLPLAIKPGDPKPHRIWEDATRLGGPVSWMLRSEITTGYIDAAIPFIDQAVAEKKPFYVNLWPDDVHSPFWPPVDRWAKGKRGMYLAVLEEMDRQLGKLFDHLRGNPALRDNTIILVCSDNGPEPGAGSAGPLRGAKGALFEGGIRSPLIVWGPGWLDPGKAGGSDGQSVFAAFDLAPSLLKLAGIAPPAGTAFDGEDLSATLSGKAAGLREAPLFWRRPPDRKMSLSPSPRPMPDLAVRAGKWKLLCDHDGSKPLLFDLMADPGEANDLAAEQPETVGRLSKAVLTWHASMPPDKGLELGAGAAPKRK